MTRHIPFSAYDPHVKNALNHVAINTVAETGKPVSWLSGWTKPTVNIGRDQDVKSACDLEAIKDDDVSLVRRQGGGGAVYLAPGNEISWSLVTPAAQRRDSIEGIHRDLAQTIIDALERLGIDAWHEAPNDVVTNDGKISGGTLRETRGVVYTGCTLLYDVNTEAMFRYLDPDPSKHKAKGYNDASERVTSIKDLSGASFHAAVKAVENTVLDHTGFKPGSWTDQEREDAERHAHKLSGDEWVYGRPDPA